jgi:DNA-binding IclR family transcriptional regulator
VGTGHALNRDERPARTVERSPRNGARGQERHDGDATRHIEIRGPGRGIGHPKPANHHKYRLSDHPDKHSAVRSQNDHDMRGDVIRCCLLDNDFTQPDQDSPEPSRGRSARAEDAAVAGAGEGEERSASWLRALTVLEILGEPSGAGGMGVVELARRLGRDKSQVSRLLRALATAGYVEREPRSARYRLGARLFALAAPAIENRLRGEADALVERESMQLGERVEVTVRSGAVGVTLATAALDVELRSLGWVGRTVPLGASAAGRALLFDHTDDAVTRLLTLGGLDGAGPAAPRSLDDLLGRLRDDRRRGWSLAREESGSDVVALGAPVRDAARRIVAAVSVSGPGTRLSPALPTVSAAVLRAAGELSTALGYDVVPAPRRPRRRPPVTATGTQVPAPRRAHPDDPHPEQPGEASQP